MSGYALAHVDDIPELEASDEAPIRPVRHHFGIKSFGVNAWVGKNAGDRLINEHEEDPGSEELYIVTRGRAVFELDGERREAPAGTLVFVQPEIKRTAFAEEAGTTLVAVGGTVGQAYDVVGWELWYPLRKRYQEGENEEVAALLREEVAANPQYPLLRYNLACLDCLTGRPEEGLEHLTKAVELWPKFREYARNDSDLDLIRDEPAFQQLIAEPQATPG